MKSRVGLVLSLASVARAAHLATNAVVQSAVGQGRPAAPPDRGAAQVDANANAPDPAFTLRRQFAPNASWSTA
jgi:hypothetical protein